MKLFLAVVFLVTIFLPLFVESDTQAEPRRQRPRELGIRIGVLPAGRLDAITDVGGVKVGHLTLKEGDTIRTGVTVVLPHDGNLYQEKVPGAIYVGNGFGKLAGLSQVEEVGTIETPIAITNTLSVGAAMEGVVRYTLSQPGNTGLVSINPVIGEINDGYLNDIQGLHIRPNHVLQAIKNARGGPVEEGSVGAGFGARAMGYKSGIGTASRALIPADGGWTLGVLAVPNFSGSLTVAGVPVGRMLKKREPQAPADEKGSIIVIIATDAPLDAKSLKRVAARAMFGIARVGSDGANRSGDYIIAFSTDPKMRAREGASLVGDAVLEANQLNPLFIAVEEAAEEAILNALFMARAVEGREDHRVEPLPLDDALRVMREYRALRP